MTIKSRFSRDNDNYLIYINLFKMKKVKEIKYKFKYKDIYKILLGFDSYLIMYI